MSSSKRGRKSDNSPSAIHKMLMSKDDDDDDDDDVAKRKTNVQTRVSDAVLSKFIHFLGFLKRLPSKENPRGCLADICFKNKDTTHLKVTLVTFVSVFIFLPCR